MMKKPTLLALFCLIFVSSVFSQTFKNPTEGKSLIYFVRFSGTGALINFKYFDGDKYLGKMNGVNYNIYECDPGSHIFWVAAENRDFIKGDLKPNSTYVVEVRPTMGAVKARVQLYPVSPTNEKVMKKVQKIMSKTTPKQLVGQDEDMEFYIKNGLDRYDKIQEEVEIIDSNWTF